MFATEQAMAARRLAPATVSPSPRFSTPKRVRRFSRWGVPLVVADGMIVRVQEWIAVSEAPT
jgi:hypothetical protein